MTGFEHGDADEAKGNHVHEEFLVKGCGGLTMPGGSLHGVFKIAIEGLDVPAHMIEGGQL